MNLQILPRIIIALPLAVRPDLFDSAVEETVALIHKFPERSLRLIACGQHFCPHHGKDIEILVHILRISYHRRIPLPITADLMHFPPLLEAVSPHGYVYVPQIKEEEKEQQTPHQRIFPDFPTLLSPDHDTTSFLLLNRDIDQPITAAASTNARIVRYREKVSMTVL